MPAFRPSSMLAAIVSAASLVTSLPASGYQTSQFTPFNLVTYVTQGNAAYGNLQIIGQHSGAAQNIVVADPENTPGLNFSAGGYVLNNTYIDIKFEPGSNLPPYSLGLTKGGYPFIKGINGAVNQGTNLNGNAGQQTVGFVIDNEGFICYLGSMFPFETFTVCGGTTLSGRQDENQLFWRNTTSTPDLAHCADVRLKVEFP